MNHLLQIFRLAAVLLLSVQAYAQTIERERVYLQTDKQLYLAGEPVWMKLYTTDANGQLMSLSKTGYVEILSGAKAEVQAVIEIRQGTGAGCITLPPALSTGYYRLVAYTRYMRNETPDVFFEKTIGIINPSGSKDSGGDITAATPVLPEAGDEGTSGMIIPDRTVYARRSQGNLAIKLPEGNFSIAVSIAGIDPLFPPSSYMNNWKNSLGQNKDAFFSNKYTPEYEGHIINGTLIDLGTGEPAARTLGIPALLSLPGNEVQVYGAMADADGNVSFTVLPVEGKREVATVAFSAGKRTYRVDVKPPFATHAAKKAPQLSAGSSLQTFIDSRAKGILSLADTSGRTSTPRPFYPPNHSYNLSEYTRFATMEEVFVEIIPQARIQRTPEGRVFNVKTEDRSRYSPGNALVLLDNIPVINHELMAAYNPQLVKAIDVYLGQYIFGGLQFHGILAFWTDKNNYPGIRFDASTQLFDYDGALVPQKFHAPTYGEGNDTGAPDFRHTLLWEPFIESRGATGLHIPFSTSDVPGDYLITVEGINKEGRTVSSICRITVE